MAILDPAGIFDGDRMRYLSQGARLYWPYIYALHNGFGRIELDPERIAAKFWNFPEPPSPVEIEAYLREYCGNFLLFAYTASGQSWGQWWSEVRWPDHKTAADRKSPVPPTDELQAWKESYLQQKQQFKSKYDKLHMSVRGVGVGVGVGVGENLSASQANAGTVDAPHSQQIETPKAGDALLSSNGEAPALPGALLSPHVEAPAPSRKKNRDVLTPWQREKFDAIWAIYWRKRDKAASEKAFAVKVKTEELYAKVRAAVIAQTHEMLTREPQHRPYFATWLNKARWEDEPEAGAVGPEDPIDRAKREYIARQKEAKK